MFAVKDEAPGMPHNQGFKSHELNVIRGIIFSCYPSGVA